MRTFTFEQLHAGETPKPAAFEVVRQQAAAVCTADPFVEWAILAGSVLRGQQTIASDIDLVICCKADTGLEAWYQTLASLKQLRLFAVECYVPLDLTFVTAPDLARHTHTLTPGYANHLKWAAEHGGLLYGDPSSLQGLPLTPLQDAHGYLTRKLAKCRGMLELPISEQQGDFWFDWLADILSVGDHALRRFGEVYGHQEDISGSLPLENLVSPTTVDLAILLHNYAEMHLQDIEEQRANLHKSRWRWRLEQLGKQGWHLYEFLMALQLQLLTDHSPPR